MYVQIFGGCWAPLNNWISGPGAYSSVRTGPLGGFISLGIPGSCTGDLCGCRGGEGECHSFCNVTCVHSSTGLVSTGCPWEKEWLSKYVVQDSALCLWIELKKAKNGA